MKSIYTIILLTSLSFAQGIGGKGGAGGKAGFGGGVSAGGGTWSQLRNCNASSSLVCVFASNPAQHDTVVISLGSTTAAGTAPAAACVDTNSNAYTVSVGAGTFGGGATGGLFEYIAYILDAPANADKTITCSNFGAGFHDIQGTAAKDTGGTPVLDQIKGSADPSASTPAVIIPTFTPAVAGSFSYCGVLPNNGISSINSPWTLASNNNSASEYQLNTPASAQTANFTDTANGDNYAAACIVVKP